MLLDSEDVAMTDWSMMPYEKARYLYELLISSTTQKQDTVAMSTSSKRIPFLMTWFGRLGR